MAETAKTSPCIPGVVDVCQPKDNSAKIARQQEQERQARIAAGRGQVDQTLSGFDDDFFNRRADEYAGHYMPQVDRQFEDARDTSVKGLARQGSLGSSWGAKMMSDLSRTYETSRSDVANRAVDKSRQARQGIEGVRGDLYGQLEAGLSPGDAANRAALAAEQYQTASDYSPLGDIFAGQLGQFGNAAILQQQGFRGTGVGLLNPGGAQKAAPSNRVVR